MKAIDFRNANFDSIRRGLDFAKMATYHGWLLHGPGTTREVSERCGIDLLTFRPRTSELMDMGLVVLAENQPHKREGVYTVATRERWEAFARDAANNQLTLL